MKNIKHTYCCCLKYGQQRAQAKASAATAGSSIDTNRQFESTTNPRRSQTINSIQPQQPQPQQQQPINYSRVTPTSSNHVPKFQHPPRPATAASTLANNERLSDKFARIGSFESVLNRNGAIQGKLTLNLLKSNISVFIKIKDTSLRFLCD